MATVDLTYDNVTGVCASYLYTINPLAPSPVTISLTRQGGNPLVQRLLAIAAVGTVLLPTQTNQRLLFSVAAGPVFRRNTNFSYSVYRE